MPTLRVLRVAAALGAEAHELAGALLIEALERIVGENALGYVFGKELACVVAAVAKGKLGQIVGAKAEKLGLLGDLVGEEGGTGDFDHSAY